jgi:L-amino acid N-acyltransferase YncA
MMSVPPDSVSIRPASDADMDAVAAIHGHHVPHGRAWFETEPPGAAEMRHRRADVVGKGLAFFVAVQRAPEHPRDADAGQAGTGQAGGVLGYAYGSSDRPRVACAHMVENAAYPRPDAVGRRIGRRLPAAVVAACEPSGLRRMVGVVGDPANGASMRLHGKLGFRRAGVLLQRSLRAGSGAPPAGADG